MPRFRFAWCTFVFVMLAAAAPLVAQKPREYGPGPDGSLQWKPFVQEACDVCAGKAVDKCKTCEGGEKKLFIEKCPDCKGKKTTPCRRCFGTGKSYDTLQTISCPMCDARGVMPCVNCGGGGFMKFQDGTKGPACKLCDKKGMTPCELCAGKRFIKLDLIGGKPIDQAAQADLDAYLRKIQGLYDSTVAFLKEDSPKTIGTFDKMAEKAIALFPYFKTTFPASRKRSEFVLEKMKDLKENQDRAVKYARAQPVYALNSVLVAHLNGVQASLDMYTKNAEAKKGPPAPAPGEKKD